MIFYKTTETSLEFTGSTQTQTKDNSLHFCIRTSKSANLKQFLFSVSKSNESDNVIIFKQIYSVQNPECYINSATQMYNTLCSIYSKLSHLKITTIYRECLTYNSHF
jgi:hypothetical protein